jgi:hypothetical protein
VIFVFVISSIDCSQQNFAGKKSIISALASNAMNKMYSSLQLFLCLSFITTPLFAATLTSSGGSLVGSASPGAFLVNRLVIPVRNVGLQ